MKSKKLWITWLMIDAIIMIIGGIIFAFFYNVEPFSAITGPILAVSGFGEFVISDFQKMMMGLVGVPVIALGVLFFFLVWKGIKSNLKWSGLAIFVSILIYYVLETIFFLQYEVYLMLWLNTIYLVLIMVPLFMSKSVKLK